MKITGKISAVISLLFLTALIPQMKADDILDQKKELERIKNEIEQSQDALDSLQSIEKKVLKEITNYEQQASANQTVLNRLNKQLNGIRRSLDDSKDKLGESQKLYERSRSRYISNINFYYMGTRDEGMEYISEIDQEKGIFRKMVYLKALAAYDKVNLTENTDLYSQAATEYRELVDREKEVGQAQKKKKSEYVILSSNKESRERDLSKLRRTKERETDRLLTLSEAARQMEELVARLERNRKERESEGGVPAVNFAYETGNFDSYKGGLAAPMKGKITSGYGWKQDRVTNLKSFSPGIEITGKKKGMVNSVSRGVIAYIGFLRGYGSFMIVEHEDGYYSMYAGIDDIQVEQNQIINKGDKLGFTSTGIIKFELRKGRDPLDPMEWLRIDSFN